MIPLYTQDEFDKTKSRNFLPCRCENCLSVFQVQKKLITYELKNKRGNIRFCSISCSVTFNKNTKKYVNCLNCGTSFQKHYNQIIKSPNHFCNLSCAALFRNKNKTQGFRRSKLEIWLEDELNKIYPNTKILYNDRNTIGYELDVFFSDLNIAFELNGVFHYKPIYGNDKLQKTKRNDLHKIEKCQEKNICLCIIDVTQMINFKIKRAEKYLNIITSIINNKIGAPSEI